MSPACNSMTVQQQLYDDIWRLFGCTWMTQRVEFLDNITDVGRELCNTLQCLYLVLY